MKKILVFVLITCMVVSFAGCAQQQEPMPATVQETPDEPTGIMDGTFGGTGHGFGGELKVAVTVADGIITTIDVTEHSETAGVSDFIIMNQPQRIIDAQSYEVDLITGATFTANAIKQAVKGALEDAGATAGMFDTPKKIEMKDETIYSDVVVIGSGMAGMSAAIEASKSGASVIVLEKLGRIGGSAITCGGGVYATGSPLNKDFDNDPQNMVDYYLQRSNDLGDKELLTYLAEQSGSSIEWLMENGTEFKPDVVPGGLSAAKRVHWTTDAGVGLIMPAYQKALDLGVEFLLETPAKELLTDESGAVIGVRAESARGNVTVNTKAVVIATGGYDASPEMMAAHSPSAVDAICLSSCGNIGDGINMAQAIGADTLFRDGVIGVRGLRANAGASDGVNALAWIDTLAVTDEGDRFVNEQGDYPVVTGKMIGTGRELFYWIYDSSMVDLAEMAVQQRLALKADTIEELAKAAGIEPVKLHQTFDRYNELGKKGVDEDFGKEGIVPLSENGPYYAAKVRKTTIGSLGGLVINLNAEVLNTDGNAIPGLYAGGETASGQFFDKEYTVSGSLINLSIVYGRLAGTNAAAYAK